MWSSRSADKTKCQCLRASGEEECHYRCRLISRRERTCARSKKKLRRASRGWPADVDVRLQEDDKPFQVTLSNESFETYELDPPPYTLQTTKKELKRMYSDMVSIR